MANLLVGPAATMMPRPPRTTAPITITTDYCPEEGFPAPIDSERDLYQQIAAHLSGQYPHKKETVDEVQQLREKLKIRDGALTVLSIDGGGVRGFIPLMMLVKFERTYGIKCYEFFDIIMGTSTGAIIGCMIAAGHSAEDVLWHFDHKIKELFDLKRGGGPKQEGYAEVYETDLAYVVEEVRDLLELHRDVLVGAGVWDLADQLLVTTAKTAAKTWANDIAANSIAEFQNDRLQRLLAGNPVYDKSALRALLTETFRVKGCERFGNLADKHKCIVVVTSVDSKTGARVLLSATGSNEFPGSAEDAATAACVESSMSAPLYFARYKGELLDGGTLSTNMPTLSGLLHLEQLSLRTVQPATEPLPGRQGSSRERLAVELQTHGQRLTQQVFQPFDLHNTCIFSLGCGVTPVKSIMKSVLEFNDGEEPDSIVEAAIEIVEAPNPFILYDYPYGEVSRLLEIFEGGVSALRLGLGAVVATALNQYLGGILFAAVAVPGMVSTGQRAKDWWDKVAGAHKLKRRYATGFTLNALAFLKDGLARDAWTIQEDVFRSSMYQGDFRRFQVSLDWRMQVDGVWRFRPGYDNRQRITLQDLKDGEIEQPGIDDPRYRIGFRALFDGEVLHKGSYSLIGMWRELANSNLEDFAPSLEPLGTMSLRWLRCMGERFADTIEEYCAYKSTPYMSVDLVDSGGQDLFVSDNCRNFTTPQRWAELQDTLSV